MNRRVRLCQATKGNRITPLREAIDPSSRFWDSFCFHRQSEPGKKGGDDDEACFVCGSRVIEKEEEEQHSSPG